MKTTSQQRDEALTMLCDVLETLAQSNHVPPSITAKVFIDRARSGLKCGLNFELIMGNIEVAKSYVLPEGVII